MSPVMAGVFAALTGLLDVEGAFSSARGQAALPTAKEIYLRSLPPQYPEKVHVRRHLRPRRLL